MKTLAFMLLLASGGSADPCVCGGCAGISHREAVGTCAACKARFGTIDDTLCAACADSKKACSHCGKALRNPRILVGEAFLVDKQPRAGLTYSVVKGEDGKSQGLYFDPKRIGLFDVKGRVVIFAAEDGKGDLGVRERHALATKEKDFELKGESDKPVSWRAGLLFGPPSPSKDGKFSIVLPALPDWTIEVVSGDKVLSLHRFENGAWKQVK